MKCLKDTDANILMEFVRATSAIKFQHDKLKIEQISAPFMKRLEDNGHSRDAAAGLLIEAHLSTSDEFKNINGADMFILSEFVSAVQHLKGKPVKEIQDEMLSTGTGFLKRLKDNGHDRPTSVKMLRNTFDSI